MMKAKIALEDGTVLEGEGFGSAGRAKGEIVFQTGMTGYVEALTDPSYNGQILMFTYPLIGNYGVCSEDYQSEGIKTEAMVVRNLCRRPSNWRSERSLENFLENQGIPGIEGVDTRMLTRKIRTQGSMKCTVSVGEEAGDDGLVRDARNQVSIKEREGLVDEVSSEDEQRFESGGELELVMVDCGYKRNILRNIVRKGVNVTLVPHDIPADKILEKDPDGVLISSGPGNPELLDETVQTAKDLLNELPVYGICLGNQIISLALGAETFKLKFGHHGINHPVRHEDEGRVFISTQNHGFAVRKEELEDVGLRVTQVNLNDHTVEGVEHEKMPVKAVQYHPEAGPGPHDTYFFFEDLKKDLESSSR